MAGTGHGPLHNGIKFFSICYFQKRRGCEAAYHGQEVLPIPSKGTTGLLHTTPVANTHAQINWNQNALGKGWQGGQMLLGAAVIAQISYNTSMTTKKWSLGPKVPCFVNAVPLLPSSSESLQRVGQGLCHNRRIPGISILFVFYLLLISGTWQCFAPHPKRCSSFGEPGGFGAGGPAPTSPLLSAGCACCLQGAEGAPLG